MSSSDSDYSIDWLASDEEDADGDVYAESEQGLGLGPDCVRRPTSSSSFSSSSSRGGRRCPSPPTASGDSWGSACTRQHLPDGGSEDGSTMREEEDDQEEEKQEEDDEENEEEDEEERSNSFSCSSPSSCMGSHHGAESRLEHRGSGSDSDTDKPRHPWGGADTPKTRLAAHKRARSSEGGPKQQDEERPLHILQSDKDWLFARKCMELQGYLPPLSAILNGLRSGRYRERLSSFQESVAMDRIQRIMGVLQNPHMGERYVNIILKVEEMLKSWFPHIKPHPHPQHPHTHKQAAMDETPPCSKKQKLSPAGLARPLVMAHPVSGCVHPSAMGGGGKAALCVRDLGLPCGGGGGGVSGGGPYSATSLKWLHTSPICSLTAEQAQGGVASLRGGVSMPIAATGPPEQQQQQHQDQDPTQDNAVSSSTDATTPPPTAAAAIANAKAGGARGKSDSGPAHPHSHPHPHPHSLRQAPPPPPPPPPPLPPTPPSAPPSSRPPLGKINAPCLERLLKSTESIITRRGSGGVAGSGWS